MPPSLQKTPLHDAHLALGARMTEFGGWTMPVQYQSIVQEHLAVRKAAGLFDISHMGEFRVRGPDAVGFLNRALTNNVQRMAIGQGQYTLLLNEQGGTIDDLFVYRRGPQYFRLIVNASRIDTDFAALNARKDDTILLTNESPKTAAVALQGPASAAILDAWTGQQISSALGHHAMARFQFAVAPLLVARTGYTGEDGFEILVDADRAVAVWDGLLNAGRHWGLVPCGLGARDTLRLEVCYPLYGHELSTEITPIEAGLERFIDFTKPDFVGKAALLRQKEGGVPRRSIALRGQPGQPPPRAGYAVCQGGQKIGVLTSGSQSPSLQAGIGMALVAASSAQVGNSVDIEIRGKYVPMEIVKKPIFRKE
jgi:aminomethyltransferase